MSTQFNDMTNSELKEACVDFGLEVKAKNPSKPNKGEYLEALVEFKAKQDKIHGIEPEVEKEEETKPETKKDTPKRKPQSKAQLLKLALFMKTRVIVRDMQESQTKDEMISVSWGNRLIGRQTDWVDLSGEPQYVRQGAINNLKEATMVAHVSKPNGGASQIRKNRFVIVEVEPLTEKELEELANQQRMRNSKIA